MNQRDVDFFRPKHRRVVAVIVCLLWTVFEWATGAPFWGMIAGGVTFYAYWSFFHTYEEQDSSSDQ